MRCAGHGVRLQRPRVRASASETAPGGLRAHGPVSVRTHRDAGRGRLVVDKCFCSGTRRRPATAVRYSTTAVGCPSKCRPIVCLATELARLFLAGVQVKSVPFMTHDATRRVQCPSGRGVCAGVAPPSASKGGGCLSWGPAVFGRDCVLRAGGGAGLGGSRERPGPSLSSPGQNVGRELWVSGPKRPHPPPPPPHRTPLQTPPA